MKPKIIAGILAMLVIMLTPAYAAQMDITKYSGTDEINGYARSSDQITIEATAEMYGSPSMEVAARRLKIYHSGISERFQTCSTIGKTAYKCTYTTTGPYSGQKQFKIELLDADGNVIEATEKTIIIDNLAPIITDFSITPLRGTNKKVTINYKAEDYATTTSDTSTCSGIKEIGFYINNIKVAAEAGQKEQCQKENAIDYTRQVSDYEKINLCARATDMINQQSDPVCKEYEIDNQPPQIISLQLKDADGFDITGMRSGTSLTGSIEAVVKGNNDDVDAVTADLSYLNPSLTGEKMPDERYGNNYVWKDISITNPSNCKVTIRAIDDLGNEIIETKTCTVPVDDTGPEAVKIETNKTDEDGTLLIGKKGTITLEIREAGAGLFKKHVYLDLASLGRKYSSQQRADTCEIKTGDVWECTWEIEPIVPDKDYTIRLSPATRDDLDNSISSSIETTIRIDKQPPTIEDFAFSVKHAFAEYGEKTVKGDTMEFKIKTYGTFYAYANFTGIGGNYAPGTCGGENIRTCEFSQLITRSGPDNATIEFELFDRAGNKQTYSHDLIIYGLSDDTSPEYWNSTVSCSPKLIDRSTTEQKEQMIYCHINLDSTNDDAEPVFTSIDKSLSECRGQLAGISEIQMMNNGYGSKDPYMVITLELAEFAINNMSFSCPIHIASKVGDYFSKADEREIIDVELEFYDLPIGEVYENIEKDIHHEMRKAMTTMSWIDDVEKITEIARKICGYKSTITSLLSALDGVFALFPLLYSALYASGQKGTVDDLEAYRASMCNDARGPAEQFIFGLGEKEAKEKNAEPEAAKTIVERIAGTESSEAKAVQDFWEFIDMFCDFLNCRLTWDDAKYATHKKGVEAGWKESKLGTGEELFLIGGGGGGWGKQGSICTGAQNMLGASWFSEYQTMQDKMRGPGEQRQQLVDVKESLFWSTLCFCGPGIIYNLNKIRQINCKYALCLAEEVKTQGIDPAWCRAEKAYLTCTYVMGEIFAIFPLLSFYDKTVNMVKEWFENPITILGAVSGCLCGGCAELGINPFCGEGELKDDPLRQAAGYVICILPKTAAKIMDAVASIKSMPTSKDYKIGTSYCDKARELELDTKYGK